jgi:hypothetical protein
MFLLGEDSRAGRIKWAKFKLLSIIEDIGIKHRDICLTEIAGETRLKKILTSQGKVEIHQPSCPDMNDKRLVEDIMREVSEKQRHSGKTVRS